jgi:hypothetical protein
MFNNEAKELLSEYHVDDQDRLIFVDEAWHQFARDNNTLELTTDAILQKSLWEFITNQQVRHLYRLMLEKVRTTGEALDVYYRCDAPEWRRYLQMRMTPSQNGRVQFRNWLLRQEKRPPVPLLDMTLDRSEEFVIICSWCKQIKLAQDDWVEIEEAVELLGLFEVDVLPQLSHGLCPSCAEIHFSPFRQADASL